MGKLAIRYDHRNRRDEGSSVNERLRTLGEEFWEFHLADSPTMALMLGDHRFGHLHEDPSLEAENAAIASYRKFAERAEAIDPSTLTTDERVSRDVLIFDATTNAHGLEARSAELSVNHVIGEQSMLATQVQQLPIAKPEHAEALLEKYEGIGRYFVEAAARLEQGVEKGRTPIGLHARKTVEQLDEMLTSPIESDPMLAVRVPEDFSDEDTTRWKADLAAAIADHIRPGLKTYRDVISDTVIPDARPDDRPGICWLDDGDDIYQNAIRRHTSLTHLTAEEIHQIGLDSIARLDEEYKELGAEVLGTSDLTEIYGRLRDDPKLHFEDGPTIVAASEVALAKAKAAMGDWFGKLPQADCLVSETPSGPLAFYFRPAADGSRPGTFFVNTSDPSGWGRFEIEALAYHEGIPGHHLQLAIAGELQDIPNFRKHAHITAYAEGWGLYTERLADEMGLYAGPLERIGMISMDSMRAGRLVVDTGMHAHGWSRHQAIDFLASNSPMNIGQITNEVDRYIGWPGQALAYMIGRLEIMRMRQEARDTMGDRFDIKGFHDVVLSSGLMPLPTLDRMVSEWASSSPG